MRGFHDWFPTKAFSFYKEKSRDCQTQGSVPRLDSEPYSFLKGWNIQDTHSEGINVLPLGKCLDCQSVYFRENINADIRRLD